MILIKQFIPYSILLSKFICKYELSAAFNEHYSYKSLNWDKYKGVSTHLNKNLKNKSQGLNSEWRINSKVTESWLPCSDQIPVSLWD